MATPNSITNETIIDNNHMTNSNNNLNNNNDKISSKNNKHNSVKSKEKNIKNLDGSYHCQFCDKTFPRLGYLKKHEQVSKFQLHIYDFQFFKEIMIEMLRLSPSIDIKSSDLIEMKTANPLTLSCACMAQSLFFCIIGSLYVKEFKQILQVEEEEKRNYAKLVLYPLTISFNSKSLISQCNQLFHIINFITWVVTKW